MRSIALVAIAYIIHCKLLAFVVPQDIFFELKDSEINEVIYIGERNIELRCGGTSLQSTNATIYQDGQLVITSTGKDAIHVIDEITRKDDWMFTCMVNTFTNGTILHQQRSLSLNVQTVTPYCFHNGTNTGEEVLQLTCYCLDNVNCLWVTSYLRVHTSDLRIDPVVTCEHFSKTVSRAVLTPITLPGGESRGTCLFGTSPSDGCYFTLTNEWPNGFTLNLPELPSLPLWDQCEVSTAGETTSASRSVSTTSSTGDVQSRGPVTNGTRDETTKLQEATKQTPPEIIIVIVIVFVILLVICLLPMSVLIYVKRIKKKTENNSEVNSNSEDIKIEKPSPQRLESTSSKLGLIPDKGPDMTVL